MHYSMHELSDHSTQLDRSGIPYSGKLSKEKTFARIGDFRGENFRGLLAFAAPKDATPQVSRGETANFANVFSLEGFPLYGRI